jgi:hypothetical protein
LRTARRPRPPHSPHGLLAHELAEGGTRHRAHPPGAPAGRAGLDRRARLGAVAAAALAGVHELVGHVNGHAGGGLGKRDLHLHRDVAALDAPAPAAAERRPERVAAEERVEDVREGAEPVRLRGVAARVEALEAEAVVGGAPLGVGEDLVGLRGLLELLLGLRVVPVHVRVELARQLPEALLDLPVAGVARDAQHLVRIAPHSS